ncbi:hypothetical protein ACOSQ4_017632 [Xanthoceras sorbifolium]
MVDAVVSQVVQRLGDILIGEVIFLREVRNEVQWLRDELRYMQRFLQHAEERQYGDAMIRVWISDIRDFAYDIEDALDAFHLKLQRRSERIASMYYWIFDKCKETVILYNIGKKIEEFKNRINDLSRRRQLYGLQDSGNSMEGRSKDLGRLKEVIRRATSFAVEEKVVGFDDDARELLAKLLDNDPRHCIISIYGMGGLGKTTIARKLYHNSDVKMRFKDYYTTQDLLVRIIKSFGFRNIKTEDLEKMKEEDLGRYLQESLQERSYLVVIDDVWDKEAWESLKSAFPDNKNKSRVIMTTRIKNVVERSHKRTHAHKLRYLSANESWQLFYEKAFQKLNVDEELEKLGREMVQKCDGLPLAIIVLGGLLSTKKPQEWHTVKSHLWRLFPEDFNIDFEKLIFPLVAEDFIPEDEDRIMEEIAKDYFDKKKNLEMIETCRVYDFLRDLAIKKAKDLNFLYIYDEIKHSNISSIISSCPRQAIYSLVTGDQELATMCRTFSSLRYLGLTMYTPHLDNSLILNLRRLQTLVIYGLEYVNLPSEIGRLQGLRHLIENFRGQFGSSIGNLKKLQTLSTTDGGVFSFDSMANLKNFRMLLVQQSSMGDCYFSSLQPLSHCRHLIDLRLWGTVKKLPEDIYQVLPNLQCLSLKESYIKDDLIPLLEYNMHLLRANNKFIHYFGRKMMCSAKGFPRLEILLFDFEGALPTLRGLSISSNDSNFIYPERLRSLPSPD